MQNPHYGLQPAGRKQPATGMEIQNLRQLPEPMRAAAQMLADVIDDMAGPLPHIAQVQCIPITRGRHPP